jgi:hypothetical protein
MEETDRIIEEWELSLSSYLDKEILCMTNINSIVEIKNNLIKLLGNQKKDDIMFYKSLIESTHFYLTKSLNMRKVKLLNDLNFIWNRIESYKKMSEVNKTNFSALVKDYRKCSEDIMLAKQHNTNLNWVKNDKIENLEDIKNDLNEIMAYHTRLIDCFSITVDHERNFFCGNKH